MSLTNKRGEFHRLDCLSLITGGMPEVGLYLTFKRGGMPQVGLYLTCIMGAVPQVSLSLTRNKPNIFDDGTNSHGSNMAV